MRIGILIGKDKGGNMYAIGQKGVALPLDVDVSTVKNAIDAATVGGLTIEVGKKLIPLESGIMLTQNGMVKRRRFAKPEAKKVS